MIQEGIDTGLRWLNGTEGWHCSISTFVRGHGASGKRIRSVACVKPWGSLQAAMVAFPVLQQDVSTHLVGDVGR